MVDFRLYNPKTLNLVADLGDDVINHSYTVGLQGECNGTTTIEVKSSNKDLIMSLHENSHFVVVSAGAQKFGSVIESMSIRNNIATVNYIGFMGYMDKIHALPSHKAGLGDASRVVKEGDLTWEKTFYADNSAGMLFGLFYNLEVCMSKEGYPFPIDTSGLVSAIKITEDYEWESTNRINGLDLSTMRSAIDSAMSEDFMLSVQVSESNGFMWVLGVTGSHTTRDIGTFFNGDVNEGESIRRSASWAVGTDTRGRETISRLSSDGSVAYSSYFADGKPEGNKSIHKYNRRASSAMQNSELQVTFSKYDDSIGIGDRVTVDLGYVGTYTVIINELQCEGRVFSYTGQVITVDSTGVVPGIRKANNTARNLLYKPLRSAEKHSKAALRRVRRSTGMRS